MIPIKPTTATLILIWSLIPILAVSESTGPVSPDAETETRDPPRRVDDVGLREAEPPNGEAQSPESSNPPGSNKSQDEAPSLGLCDGS